MPERVSPVNGIERRGVLAALATGLGGVGLARSSLARRVDAQDASQFVVEQGDRCVPITPLSGDETVEEFYDYRTPFTSPSGEAYSSYGTTDLQRPETSICFLYDGPQGLSLVVVHDELEDGTNGGAVTFRFDGLTDGSWVVRDDDYDAPSNYDNFVQTEEGWQIDWTWGESRSDGGAYRPLGDDFAVTIDPAFNESAELYGDPYEGEITDWQILSGDRSDPERVSLALDQPLTIRSGSCSGTTTTTTQETTEEDTTEEDTTEEETEDEETTEEEQDDQQSSEPISVEVELEPRRVNPRSHGRLPVVVHSTADFDATTLARGSVEFGPKKGSTRATAVKRIRTDADRDGRTDLKLHFWMDATGIDWDTDRVELTAETTDGRAVVGVVDVQLVSRGGDDEDEDEREDERDEEREDRDDDHEGEEEDEEEREEDDEEEEDEEEKREEDDDDREEEGDDEEDDEGDEDDDEAEDEDTDENDERGRGKGRGNGRGNGQGRDNGQGRGNGGGQGNGRGGGEDD